MSQVFISYSRKNSEFARRLTDKLRMAGKDSWIDWEGIPLSSPNWWEDIKDAIEKSDNILFIMSPDSMASIVCNMELDYALDLQKRVIVVVYQEVDKNKALASIASASIDDSMKERLGGEFPLTKAHDNWVRISHINWLFFRSTDDFDSSFSKLLNALDLNLGYVKSHTRYLERANDWLENGKRKDLLLFGDEIELAEMWLKQAELFAEIERKRLPDTRIDVVNPLPQQIQFEYIRTSRNEADKAAQYLQELEVSREKSEEAAEFAIKQAQIADRARRSARHTLIIFAVLSMLFIGVGIMFAYTEFSDIQVRLEIAKTEVQEYNFVLTAVPPDLTLSAQQVLESQARFDSLEFASKAATALINEGNAEVATLLSILALNTLYTTPADSILIDALQELRTQMVIETDSPVTHVLYSPDGLSVISAAQDGTIFQWDATSNELLQVYEGYTGVVSAINFNASGDAILSSINDASTNEYVIRDVQTGKTLKVAENTREDFIKFFSINGTDYAISRNADNLYVRNINTDTIITTIALSTLNVSAFDISLDKKFIAIGDENGTVSLRLVESGELIHTLGNNASSVISLAFSEDGNHLVVGLANGSIVIWDIFSNKVVRTFRTDDSQISSLASSADGQLVAAGTQAGTLYLWQVDTDTVTTFNGHTDEITSIDFSQDGSTVITSSLDGTLRFWNIAPQERLRIASDNRSPIQSIAISPDGTMVLSGSTDNALKLWDVETHTLIHEFTGHDNSISSVSFSPDGSLILSGSIDGTVYLWDTETAELLRVFEGLDNIIIGADFSPDGNRVIGSASDGAIRVWDLKTRRTLQTASLDNAQISSTTTLGSDGTTILTGGDDGSIYRWDIATGDREVVFEGNNTPITSVALNPQGTYGLSGSYDGIIQMWNISTGETTRIFEVDNDPIHAIAFSPDGALIAVGRGSTTQNGNVIRIWDANTGEVIREINGHDDKVLSINFSPDGRFIASGSADGTIGIWHTDYQDFVNYACQQLNRDLTEEERLRYEIQTNSPACSTS